MDSVDSEASSIKTSDKICKVIYDLVCTDSPDTFIEMTLMVHSVVVFHACCMDTTASSEKWTPKYDRVVHCVNLLRGGTTVLKGKREGYPPP